MSSSVMEDPYPESTYCDVPSEAQTGVPLCRPLPKAQFPVPPPAPKPPGILLPLDSSLTLEWLANLMLQLEAPNGTTPRAAIQLL
jgi:hypothetical protein